MNAQDCLQILREVKDVTFATTDGNGRPRARIIGVMLWKRGGCISARPGERTSTGS